MNFFPIDDQTGIIVVQHGAEVINRTYANQLLCSLEEFGKPLDERQTVSFSTSLDDAFPTGYYVAHAAIKQTLRTLLNDYQHVIGRVQLHREFSTYGMFTLPHISYMGSTLDFSVDLRPVSAAGVYTPILRSRGEYARFNVGDTIFRLAS